MSRSHLIDKFCHSERIEDSQIVSGSLALPLEE